MEQQDIFGPVFAMALLTLTVWVYLYARRLPFILSSNFAPEELTSLELQRRSPPVVVNPSDNLKNLFELPVLFYVLCLYLFVTAQVDQVYLVAAWVFVGFRVLHSVMHCTLNVVPIRFLLYVVASFSLWFIAVRGAWQVFA